MKEKRIKIGKKIKGSKKKNKRVGLQLIIILSVITFLTGCSMIQKLKIESPSYSIKEGRYMMPITVKINKLKGNGVSVYYTKDGSEPTENSQIYLNPIILTEDTVLKSIAMDQFGIKSDIKSAEYLMEITELPTIKVPIFSENSDENETFMKNIYGTWVVYENGWTIRYSFTPIDSKQGMLIYSEVRPNKKGDAYNAYFDIEVLDGGNKGKIIMTNILESGISPIESELLIEFNPSERNEIRIEGVIFKKDE
jgi:hypothetical protein